MINSINDNANIDKIVDVAENLVDVVSTKRTIKDKLQTTHPPGRFG